MAVRRPFMAIASARDALYKTLHHHNYDHHQSDRGVQYEMVAFGRMLIQVCSMHALNESPAHPAPHLTTTVVTLKGISTHRTYVSVCEHQSRGIDSTSRCAPWPGPCHLTAKGYKLSTFDYLNLVQAKKRIIGIPNAGNQSSAATSGSARRAGQCENEQ